MEQVQSFESPDVKITDSKLLKLLKEMTEFEEEEVKIKATVVEEEINFRLQQP